jgi:hypothetical protein
MSLYSFNLKTISNADPGSRGKTAARLCYACLRDGAPVLSARTGIDGVSRGTLSAFALAREERAGRNGRVAECFILALPIEADGEQHAALVSAFAEKMTGGVAPWIAALHIDKPHNPHCHLYLFDEQAPRKPGQRGRAAKVIGLSRKGALEEARAMWADLHNEMMAGIAAPIDHRSLAEQGRDDLPTLHEGPAAHAVRAKGRELKSQNKFDGGGREVRWKDIDEGQTRFETNEKIRTINGLKRQLKETTVNGRRNDGIPAQASAAKSPGRGGREPDIGNHQNGKFEGRTNRPEGRADAEFLPSASGAGREIGGGGNAAPPSAFSAGPAVGPLKGKRDRWRFRPSALRRVELSLLHMLNAARLRVAALLMRAGNWSRTPPSRARATQRDSERGFER